MLIHACVRGNDCWLWKALPRKIRRMSSGAHIGLAIVPVPTARLKNLQFIGHWICTQNGAALVMGIISPRACQ